MTSPATLRFLTFLTLAAPACGSETSDTSPGSSTSAGSATADSSGAGDPTEADADTAGASTTADTADTADTTGASTSTTGGMTADPTTADPTTADTTTGGSIADCDFDPAIVFSRDALVYQLESEDGATCVWLERRDDSEPDVIYKAVPYTLREWKSGHAGVVGHVAHVTDLTAMTWESTHHNWNDVATASDGAVRYRLEDWYTFDDAFEARFGLYAYDADTDALLWGPITMLPYQQ